MRRFNHANLARIAERRGFVPTVVQPRALRQAIAIAYGLPLYRALGVWQKAA